MEQNNYNEIETERVENFDEKSNGLCVCMICKNIFIHPCQCANCKAHFCTECIDSWVSKNPGNCPLCKSFRKISPHPLLNNLLSSLKVKCAYHPKCEEVLEYDFLLKHEEHCKFNEKIPCEVKKRSHNSFSAEDFVNNSTY